MINRRPSVFGWGCISQRTDPVLEYYRARGLLRSIEGDRPMREVTEQIQRVLEEHRLPGGNSG